MITRLSSLSCAGFSTLRLSLPRKVLTLSIRNGAEEKNKGREVLHAAGQKAAREPPRILSKFWKVWLDGLDAEDDIGAALPLGGHLGDYTAEVFDLFERRCRIV